MSSLFSMNQEEGALPMKQWIDGGDKMNMQKIALVTIGQAPRHDISAAIEGALPDEVEVIHAGLLDGLDGGEIECRFKLKPGHSPLITRLTNGATCQLDPHAVEAGLQEKIDQLEQEGAGIMVILCTGRFHALRTRSAFLVEPDVVIPALLAALVHGKTLGIIVPLRNQIDECAAKWQSSGARMLFETASPYADLEHFVQAANRLCTQGVDIIVLDCMGYTQRHKQSVVDRVDIPVVVSNQAIVAAVNILL